MKYILNPETEVAKNLQNFCLRDWIVPNLSKQQPTTPQRVKVVKQGEPKNTLSTTESPRAARVNRTYGDSINSHHESQHIPGTHHPPNQSKNLVGPIDSHEARIRGGKHLKNQIKITPPQDCTRATSNGKEEAAGERGGCTDGEDAGEQRADRPPGGGGGGGAAAPARPPQPVEAAPRRRRRRRSGRRRRRRRRHGGVIHGGEGGEVRAQRQPSKKTTTVGAQVQGRRDGRVYIGGGGGGVRGQSGEEISAAKREEEESTRGRRRRRWGGGGGDRGRGAINAAEGATQPNPRERKQRGGRTGEAVCILLVNRVVLSLSLKQRHPFFFFFWP